MPLLYFRGTPGVTGTVKLDGNGNVDTTSTPVVPNTVVGETTTSTFVRTENVEYIESPGFSNAYGTSPDQSTSSPISSGYTTYGGNAAKADDAFAKLLTSGKNTTASPKGTNYLLISAGEDRIYGTSDDIIINH
jgi:hypothetical protein